MSVLMLVLVDIDDGKQVFLARSFALLFHCKFPRVQPSKLEKLAVVVAYSLPGRVIGRDGGGLPWHHPEDLRSFREVTAGHTVIMGRRTWECLPVRPLPERRNLVLSRNPALHFPGAETCPTLLSAIAAARAGGDPCPMVIGGGTVFEEALPLATVLYITEVYETHTGTTFFPPVDETQWEEVSHRASGPLKFRVLERRNI
ncbi:putative dihydrofolate reductase [Paratrimastix pyriformis]|uniref:dihydrofolate reductase n=1 Tax=Paratrimastix pyriformis TaxID=342808 RepID=A0ABQ8UVB1_9EUKA|nr:putative dihydrofolate reductase [Paratrimastix pyriformis]